MAIGAVHDEPDGIPSKGVTFAAVGVIGGPAIQFPPADQRGNSLGLAHFRRGKRRRQPCASRGTHDIYASCICD